MPHIPRQPPRPSVSISSPRVKKVWGPTPVVNLIPGDIVADEGAVSDIVLNTAEHRVDILFTSLRSRMYLADATVFAFSEEQ